MYETRDPERHVAALRAMAQVGIGGALLGAGSTMGGYPQIGMAVMAVTAVGAVWRLWRAPGADAVVLDVEDGMLAITSRRTRKRRVVPLRDIADVVLDTKSIRKVQEGSSCVPAARFIDTRVAPAVDVARIVVELEPPAPPMPLSEAYGAHMDSVEWLGKIRSFLRARGWVPEDERDADDEARGA